MHKTSYYITGLISDTNFPFMFLVENTTFEIRLNKTLEDMANNNFKSFFKANVEYLDLMTVVLSAASVGALGYKLFKNFQNDAPMYVKVLDSLQVRSFVVVKCNETRALRIVKRTRKIPTEDLLSKA